MVLRSLFTQYKRIIDVFLEEGADCFLFETLLNTHALHEVSAYIKKRCPNATIVVSFAVTADGYSRQGIAMSKLLQDCFADDDVDACGLNCVCGPMHMKRLLDTIDKTKKPILIMPNGRLSNHSGKQDLFPGQLYVFCEGDEGDSGKGCCIAGRLLWNHTVYIRKLKVALAGA